MPRRGAVLTLWWRAAEDKAKALQDALDQRSDPDATSSELLQSELEARERYENAKRRLERYEMTFGPDALGAAGADLQALAQMLEAKEKSIAELELLRKDAAEVRRESYSQCAR